MAYEYVFHNPMPNVTQAVNLKSIDSTGVTLSYAYSTSKLTSITSSNTKFETQEVAPDGSRYVYILVTLSTAMPTDFQSKVVWNQGLLGSVTIHDMDGNTYTTKIVKGQTLQNNLVPSGISLNVYGAEWYSDAEYENTLTTTQGGDIYLRVPNLPTDYLELDTGADTYYVKRGTSILPSDLVIPAYYNSKRITRLDTEVFKSQHILITIDLPNTLIIIGSNALHACWRLTQVKLPDGLVEIGWQAFAYTSITQIYIPKNVSYLGESIFRACNLLITIVVDSENAVYDSRDNCNAIIRKADNMLCHGCNATTIPNSVTGIGPRPFYNLTDVTTVYIHENIEYIHPEALIADSVLQEIVVSDDNPIYDSRDNCNAIIETKTNKLVIGIKTTIIPSSVTSIGDFAFFAQDWDNCVIPDGVISIGYQAFSFNGGLKDKTLIIPSSVITISANAFWAANNLTKVQFSNPNGWVVNGEALDLSDMLRNATYLNNTYVDYEWTRS